MVVTDCCFGSWKVSCDGRDRTGCPQGEQLGLSNARLATLPPMIEELEGRGWLTDQGIRPHSSRVRVWALCPTCLAR